MEQQKMTRGGIAYFIDFRGKIKSGYIYADKGEKLGVMGLGTVTRDILYANRNDAKKGKDRKDREQKVRESKTFEIQFTPCLECRHYEADLCDAFCITEATDGTYYHQLFKKKRKPKNG
jgi:hypothetical protein